MVRAMLWVNFVLVLCAAAVSAGEVDARASHHRITVLSLGGGNGVGVEVAAYEFINRARWGFRFPLLNGAVGEKAYKDRETRQTGSGSFAMLGDLYEGTIVYTPFWVRRYWGKDDSSVWPFIGVAAAYVDSYREHFFDDDEEKVGFKPAVEVGIDFGGKTARGFLSVRHITAAYMPLTTVNVGFSLGWRGQ